MNDQITAENAPGSAITPVTMQDGRVINFSGNRKVKKTLSINDQAVSIAFDYRDGQSRHYTIPPELLVRFAADGAVVKLGAAQTAADLDLLTARLTSGQWHDRTSGGLSGTSILVRALVKATGKTLAEVQALLATKSQADKMKMRKAPKLAAVIAELEAEDAGDVSENDKLLEGFF